MLHIYGRKKTRIEPAANLSVDLAARRATPADTRRDAHRTAQFE